MIMNQLTNPPSLLRSSLIFIFSSLLNLAFAEVDTPVEDTAYYLCGGCHGQENVRVDYMPPNIIGQKKGYLAKQLKAYRDQKRTHPNMNGALEAFSDKNIDDLASYYANTSVYLLGSKEQTVEIDGNTNTRFKK